MKKKNRFAYVKKQEVFSQALSKRLSKTDSTLLKLYQDCRIPLDIFLECLFDKDFTRLCISGIPTDEDILKAWETIYLEYAEIINDGSHNELYDKTIEINYLTTKVFIIDKIITHFKLSHNEDLEQILNFYGVKSGILESDSTEERFKKCEIVIAKSKRWITQLDILRKEYEALQDQGTTVKSGREQFEDNLSGISTYRKYTVLEKDINVRQYVKALKSMEREYNRLSAKYALNGY